MGEQQTVTNVFSVEPQDDGYTIYANRFWGLGHTFKHREYADEACRRLNNAVALDQQHQEA